MYTSAILEIIGYTKAFDIKCHSSSPFEEAIKSNNKEKVVVIHMIFSLFNNVGGFFLTIGISHLHLCSVDCGYIELQVKKKIIKIKKPFFFLLWQTRKFFELKLLIE